MWKLFYRRNNLCFSLSEQASSRMQALKCVTDRVNVECANFKYTQNFRSPVPSESKAKPLHLLSLRGICYLQRFFHVSTQNINGMKPAFWFVPSSVTENNYFLTTEDNVECGITAYCCKTYRLFFIIYVQFHIHLMYCIV